MTVGSRTRRFGFHGASGAGLHATSRGAVYDPFRRVVLALQGGLGNQLFQWALGYRLRAAGIDVVVDAVRCRGDRPLALGALLATWPCLARPVGLGIAAAHRVGRRLPGIHMVTDRYGSGVADRLERAASPCYLLGYFQSPQYFDVVAAEVRELVLRELGRHLTPEGHRAREALRSDPDSVAVHVRRGDYITDAAAAATNGALNASYYDTARAQLNQLGLHRITWFSDDLPWVRHHLAASGDAFCTPDLTTADGGEIAIMAACRTRVIANSSFSWWAAWLGEPATVQRPVIAPRRWFIDPEQSADDLLIPGWTTR